MTSLIASEYSFASAMTFFTVVNVIAFLGTLVFIPSMPAAGRASYGEQLRVLRRSSLWYSIFAVMFLNGAVFGFFSFLSDYLSIITTFSFKSISLILLIYGAANIPGNIIAGKFLSSHPRRTLFITPVLLAVVLFLIMAVGELGTPTVLLIVVLGVLSGVTTNETQFMPTNAASEAPTFANGLYLTSANLGTAVGTAVCGAFISAMGTRYAIMGSLVFLVLSLVFVALRDGALRHSREPAPETVPMSA